jgi:MFS family permease
MQINAFRKIKNIFLTYYGFPRVVYFVFIARFINAMGYFVFPFLTLFLTKNLSLSVDKVGIYLMLVEVGRISGALLGGKTADCLGRKPVLMGAQITTAFFLFPCAFLGESLLIPKLLIFAAFFNGAVHPAIDAILVDVSHPVNRKEIFSFIYLGLNLGFGIGSLIAGFLYTNFMQLLFVGNVMAILIVTVVIGFYVPETRPELINSETLNKVKVGPGTDMLDRRKPEKMISALVNQPIVLYFFLVSIIFFLVHSQFFFSLPLQIDAIFLEQGPEYFGIVMSFNCLIVVLMTVPITWLTRHNRSVVNVFWSGLLFAFGFGMLRWISFLGWILLSTFIWTLGEILLRINTGVFIANHSPATLRGRFNSLVTVSGSIGRIIGPPLLGLIIAGFGIRSIWVAIFTLSIMASLLMYLIYCYENNSVNIKND